MTKSSITKTPSGRKIHNTKAMWLWNNADDMIVVEHGKHYPEHKHLHNSTGACFSHWLEYSEEDRKDFLFHCVGADLYDKAVSLVEWEVAQ